MGREDLWSSAGPAPCDSNISIQLFFSFVKILLSSVLELPLICLFLDRATPWWTFTLPQHSEQLFAPTIPCLRMSEVLVGLIKHPPLFYRRKNGAFKGLSGSAYSSRQALPHALPTCPADRTAAKRSIPAAPEPSLPKGTANRFVKGKISREE